MSDRISVVESIAGEDMIRDVIAPREMMWNGVVIAGIDKAKVRGLKKKKMYVEKNIVFNALTSTIDPEKAGIVVAKEDADSIEDAVEETVDMITIYEV